MATERVERRLVTVLAADIAGYARLTELDEEGTLARLKAHRRELIDPKIDAPSEHYVLGILQRPGPGDRQKPEVGLFAGKDEGQIDRVISPFGDDGEKSGVNFVAHGVA